MREQWIVMQGVGGLHARVAAGLVQTARNYAAASGLELGERRATMGSITELLALGAAMGDRLRLWADGPEEQQALRALAALLAAPEGGEHNAQGVSAGIAQGRVYRVDTAVPAKQAAIDVAHELARLDEALARATAQLASWREWAARTLGAESEAILAAQQELLRDERLRALWREGIASDGLAAEQAVQRATARLGEERGLAGRALENVRDVAQRLLAWLREAQRPAAHDGPLILVGREVLPSHLIAARAAGGASLVGAISNQGGALSHAAILARALGIPLLTGAEPALLDALDDGDWVWLDAQRGLWRAWKDGQSPPIEAGAGEKASRAAQGPVSELRWPVALWANADTPDAVNRALALGAQGIGLVRSEWLFLGRDAPPDEDEQYHHYAAILEAARGYPATFRAADLGADKLPDYMRPLLSQHEQEVRGARLMGRYPALWRVQFAALTRAARHAPLRLMFPSIATLDEWRQARALWQEACAQSDGEASSVTLGVLLETPSLAWMLDGLAGEAAFVSVGTNDLAARLLGRERSSTTDDVYAWFWEPALWRVLAHVLREARRLNLSVSVCGALASEPLAAVLLAALGVDALSVEVAQLDAVRYALAEASPERAAHALQGLLAQSDRASVERWLRATPVHG